MNKLEKELREQSNTPNQTAVKYTKANEMNLCREYKVSRGALRQLAVMLDKQTAAGFKVEEAAKRKERKTAKKEEKVKTAKTDIPEKEKADAKPPKPKAKKPKAKAKKKSKPKT